MLRITIPAGEDYDSSKNLFLPYGEQHLTLEHSLVSISKWEAKWKKPFLHTNLTNEQLRDYICCMSITPIELDTVSHLTISNVAAIRNYIEDPMTATWFRETRDKGRPRIITSELIYGWMVSLGIPFECQKWHLNRLMTLIRVINEENKTPTKRSASEIAQRNYEENERRRRAYGTSG